MSRTKNVAWVLGAGLAALLAGCGGDTGGNATIAGAVSGLAANTSVVLDNNGGDNLTVSADGTFHFSQTVASQGSYDVLVVTQPTNQTCTVTNGSGVVDFSGDSIGNIAVSCTNNATVGAEVTGLDSGDSVQLSLTLQNNPLSAYHTTVTANNTVASFTDSSGAAVTLPLGTLYTVAVAQQPTNPAQVCSISSNSPSPSGGVVSSNAVTVEFQCQ